MEDDKVDIAIKKMIADLSLWYIDQNGIAGYAFENGKILISMRKILKEDSVRADSGGGEISPTQPATNENEISGGEASEAE